MAAKKRGESALGGKKKSSKKSPSKSKKPSKKVRRIHLSRADSGEMLAEHEHEPGQDGMSVPNASHVVPDGGLDAHVAEHMPAPEPEAPGAAPQMPAPGGPMGM